MGGLGWLVSAMMGWGLTSIAGLARASRGRRCGSGTVAVHIDDQSEPIRMASANQAGAVA